MKVIEFGVSPCAIKPSLDILVSSRRMFGGTLQGVEPLEVEVYNRLCSPAIYAHVETNLEWAEPTGIDLILSPLKPTAQLVDDLRSRIGCGEQCQPQVVEQSGVYNYDVNVGLVAKAPQVKSRFHTKAKSRTPNNPDVVTRNTEVRRKIITEPIPGIGLGFEHVRRLVF